MENIWLIVNEITDFESVNTKQILTNLTKMNVEGFLYIFCWGITKMNYLLEDKLTNRFWICVNAK